MGDYDHHKTIYPPHPRISDFPTTPKDHMFRILEREKQATAEGSGDVESSNEIPYELAQFEIHLRQPVKIHNIRKRMQLEQQASSSENDTNGRKVSVDKNGREVDPILAFAKTQHFYAEGPDFLLSDLILYPLYSLIMHRFSKVSS